MDTRDETLYKKIGKKYVAVSDPWAYEGLRDGMHLVYVRPGCTTIRRVIWPDRVEAQAAIEIAREAMTARMLEANKLQPARPLTAKEKRAWKAYCEVMGDEHSGIALTGKSIEDIIDAGLAAINDWRPY